MLLNSNLCYWSTEADLKPCLRLIRIHSAFNRKRFYRSSKSSKSYIDIRYSDAIYVLYLKIHLYYVFIYCLDFSKLMKSNGNKFKLFIMKLNSNLCDWSTEEYTIL